MTDSSAIYDKIRTSILRDRLVDTAVRLIGVPSPTGDAGKVAETLAEMLASEGFDVQRLEAGHAKAPAVVVRYESGRPGPTLQFNGHLDTVHLPFVAPGVREGVVTGSGASDMKGGIAAAIEALRVIREIDLLPAGGILFTGYDLHEAPWGLGEQLDNMIKEGCHGDAVLIPEPLCTPLPTVGRGSATWRVTFRRKGEPIHEVMRPPEEPSVIAAGMQFHERLENLDTELRKKADPYAGSASVFIGQIHSGEIFNQYPQECWLEGTRRWLPGTNAANVEAEFKSLVQEVAAKAGVTAEIDYRFVRDAFQLDISSPIVSAFQEAYVTVSGAPLAAGPKPFVDDGNSFWGLANIPAITHGPKAGGQHTIAEWVSIDDLVRVTSVYCLTAYNYCRQEKTS